MLEDILALDSKNISTIEYGGKEVDPNFNFKPVELEDLRNSWSMKTDNVLNTSILILADHVIEMYYLIKSHEDKVEIQSYIDSYNSLMLSLNKLGVIEPDYYEGKV